MPKYYYTGLEKSPIECENDFPSPLNAEDIQEEVPYVISVSHRVPINESRIPSHQFSKYLHDGFLSGRALFNSLKFTICRMWRSED